MSTSHYNEKAILDKKIEETWYILRDMEKELKARGDITKIDRGLAFLRRFKVALTSITSEHLLFIEDEEQILQSINFRGSQSLEKYDFKEGKNLYFILLDKRKRLIHYGIEGYKSRYWYEVLPVRLRIIEMDKEGDTISVNFLSRNHANHSGSERLVDKPDFATLNRPLRIVGKIDMNTLSECLIYLYEREVINDNIGLELINLCSQGLIYGLDAYLEHVCFYFSSYFKRFKARPGDWLKIYLLLHASITNNLLVITEDSDDTPNDDLSPNLSIESPIGYRV